MTVPNSKTLILYSHIGSGKLWRIFGVHVHLTFAVSKEDQQAHELIPDP